MTKHEQMNRIENRGIVAIIRADDASELTNVVDAIRAGGVDIVEVTMTTPGALNVISEVSKTYGNQVLIGAGSVLDAETARMAILSGAEFIVSPATKSSVIDLCNRYGKVVMPGAFTPTEILTAWELGADYVKVFPADVSGASYIKGVKAPLPQVQIIPTGGIGLDNAADFIAAGATALGIGSTLVNNKIISEKRFDELKETANRLVDVVKETRKKQENPDG